MKTYPVGLSGLESLIVTERTYYHSELLDSIRIQRIKCDRKDKQMVVTVKEVMEEKWKRLNLINRKENDIIDMDDKGNRWEGDSINGSPYGFGSIYNEMNCLVYTGFIYNGLKVCFGVELYGDTGKIQYSGNFYKNMRHGYGKLYDRHDLLVYEGEWSNDQPIQNERIEIRNKEMTKIIHFGIEELVISNGYEGNMTRLIIDEYSHLKRFEIGDGFQCPVDVFQIVNCNKLEEVKIGYRCFSFMERKPYWLRKKKFDSFCIKNCAKLNSIIIGEESFIDYENDMLIKNLPSIQTLSFPANSFKGMNEVIIDNLVSLNTLLFGEYSFKTVKEFHLFHLPHLTTLTTRDSSFRELSSLVISSLPCLKEISFGDWSFHDTSSCHITNLPQLTSISISKSSFHRPTAFVLSDLPLLSQITRPPKPIDLRMEIDIHLMDCCVCLSSGP